MDGDLHSQGDAMNAAFVTTITERCRMCYTCVRECPAKAIRVAEGQAQVIAERCIACGNCVRVCSQHAKQPRSSVAEVQALLDSGEPVAACLAPSFPAEFTDLDDRQLVGKIRALGFRLVNEVAFGADLVAREYRRLLAASNSHRYVATTCPAVVGYVEQFYPDLVDRLAPVVSPMVATARVVRRLHGQRIRVVFIGPCIGKKMEAASPYVQGEIDAALTFLELRQMFRDKGLDATTAVPSDFDLPHGATGALFPISRGILQAAEIREDLMTGEVVAVEGRSHFLEAVKEFADGDLGAKLLEALCCEGCIMGAGIGNELPLFNRRRRVREHVCRRMRDLDQALWEEAMEQMADLDLRRAFVADDQRLSAPPRDELVSIMARMGKLALQDELNCGACGYDTCREHATAIWKGLAESEMCLPNTIDQLREALKEVEASNKELAETQEALVQSEKLASMGQLAAGIAHEVNNPLGVVLMYAHLLFDQCDANSSMREDLALIAEQADRCKRIVAALLDFARQNKVIRSATTMCEIVERAMRGVHIPETIQLLVEHEAEDLEADVDRDQIVQVVTNLVNNAVAAMDQGGLLTIHTGGNDATVHLSVSDTGVGIPTENLNKIFEPFFTTKRLGKGTGLGLAVTYGIVKMHGGAIRVQSQTDPTRGPTGSTFTVSLPRHE